VQALRAVEKYLGLEALYILGTNCVDNGRRGTLDKFLAAASTRPDQVLHYEFNTDYRVGALSCCVLLVMVCVCVFVCVRVCVMCACICECAHEHESICVCIRVCGVFAWRCTCTRAGVPEAVTFE